MTSDPAETEMLADDSNDAEGGTSNADVAVQLAHAEDQWRRTAADLDNLQKRFRREVERGRVDERERILSLWIQSIDDLGRSLDHAGTGGDAMGDGIRSIVDRAVSVFASLGYERFGGVGDQFDPSIHEVISTVPATEAVPVNQIVAVVTPGYGTAEHLLRAASVVVAVEGS